MDTRASLLLRIKDPADTRAWSEFDAIYRPMLLRFARSQGLTEADAEDEVQRCMSAIHQIMSDFEYNPQKGRFKSWLRTMVNNRCRNHRRDHHARMARLRSPRNQPRPQEKPEEAFDRIWMEEHLKHCLRLLRAETSEQRFGAYEAYAIQQKSASEVCAAFDLTPGQLYKLKWQMTHALREKVASLLKGRGACLSNFELQRYHAGEVGRDDTRRIEDHLAACPECAEKNARILANHDKVCEMLRTLDLES